MLNDQELLHAAEQAYRRGRVRWALRIAAWVVPLVGLSLVWAPIPSVNVVAGLTLILLATALRFRGMGLQRAVDLGLMAGVVAFVTPLFVAACTGGGCAVSCWSHCMTPCISAGAAAGVFIGLRSLRGTSLSWTMIGGATAIASLCGVMGCAPFGPLGMGVMGGSMMLSAVVMHASGRG